MAKVQIETTQNVLLDFELGDIGDRIGAAIIDEIIKGLYALITILVAISSLSDDFLESGFTSFLFIKFLLSIPILFYYPALEYFWNGQTIGKKLMKLRVIKHDGSKPSIGDFIIRFLFRTIDTQGGFIIALIAMSTFGEKEIISILIFLFLAPFPIIGILTIAFTKKKQRVGDLLSGTLVVKIKQRTSLEDTMLLSVKKDYKPKYENVLRFNDRDIRMIKEALDLYKKTDDPKNIIILANKTRELLEIKGNPEPAKLLTTILRDYNILAVQKSNN